MENRNLFDEISEQTEGFTEQLMNELDDDDISDDYFDNEDESEGFSDLENFETTTLNNLDSDDTGALLDGETLLSDEQVENDTDTVEIGRRDWISPTGEIVVMDNSNTEGSFRLEYIDINKVAISHRIRLNNNVEDMVKSIKSTGLLEPLTVAPTATNGIYVLLNGYRRILACARAGIRKIPCIVNNKVNTSEIPVLEAMYNHCKAYTIKEMIEYIDYLEKEKGIFSASMIEYLLQMNSGDYTKLKDILNDDDEDIVSKLLEGQLTIEQAFKKLEQRRKKESAEEKAIKKAEKVYEDEKESGVESLAGAGEQADETVALSDDEIKELTSALENLDDDEDSLDDVIKDGNSIEGYEPPVQEVGGRERIDPAIKEATLQRDGYKCKCCEFGGPGLKSILDFHHALPVFLGGADTVDNGVTLCITCHNLVHQWSYGKLNLVNIQDMDEEAQLRFKKIIKLGNIIREGMAKKGIKASEEAKKANLSNVGRRMPGAQQNADI